MSGHFVRGVLVTASGEESPISDKDHFKAVREHHEAIAAGHVAAATASIREARIAVRQQADCILTEAELLVVLQVRIDNEAATPARPEQPEDGK